VCDNGSQSSAPWSFGEERRWVNAYPPEIVALAGQRRIREMFHEAWLLCDRSWRADDNAEHLYRYLLSIGMPVNAWFVLDRRSPDWTRLEAEGFRLLPFGTRQHGIAALLSRHVVSSHVGATIPSPYPDHLAHGFGRRTFTFLGHGIAANENAAYLNQRPIDRVICANEREAAFMREDGNFYRTGERELVVTGLPRHDGLLPLQSTRPDRILVMPTWRKSLLRGSKLQEIDAEFERTDYFRRWHALVRSHALHALAENARLGITFLLHPMMRGAAEHFAVPGVETIVQPSGSIQSLLARSALLLTDYSSVCFDMAYLARPTVHYQFDEAEFFGGAHTVRRGWFDYRRDGFGPVCEREEDVISEVHRILLAGGAPERLYAQRMRDFFPFRDGRCCERVYQAIRENN
jgi:CDP-glycerol glycerophosphotransferase (TagB/SpsB family)